MFSQCARDENSSPGDIVAVLRGPCCVGPAGYHLHFPLSPPFPNPSQLICGRLWPGFIVFFTCRHSAYIFINQSGESFPWTWKTRSALFRLTNSQASSIIQQISNWPYKYLKTFKCYYCLAWCVCVGPKYKWNFYVSVGFSVVEFTYE